MCVKIGANVTARALQMQKSGFIGRNSCWVTRWISCPIDKFPLRERAVSVEEISSYSLFHSLEIIHGVNIRKTGSLDQKLSSRFVKISKFTREKKLYCYILTLYIILGLKGLFTIFSTARCSNRTSLLSRIHPVQSSPVQSVHPLIAFEQSKQFRTDQDRSR